MRSNSAPLLQHTDPHTLKILGPQRLADYPGTETRVDAGLHRHHGASGKESQSVIRQVAELCDTKISYPCTTADIRTST